MIQQLLRGLRIVAGVALVALGCVLAMPMIPGPGLVLIVGGLTLLGQEFHWARRLNLWLRRQGNRIIGRSFDE